MAGKKILSLIVFALLASATQVLAEDTIKIGLQGAHSGNLAGYGVPELNAAKLVVAKYNAKGGLLGKQIELIAEDDQCKSELSTKVASKLISDGLTLIIGPTCSGPTKAVLPMYNEKKVLVISPSATSPELTQSGDYPYFFRTTSSDDAQAKLGADFVLNKLGAKKIAMIHDKSDYGRGYSDFVKKFIEEDGRAKVIMFEGITPGAVDYSSSIQKVARSGADVLIFGGYYPEASKLVSAIKKKRLKINFVSEDGVQTKSFIDLAGKNAEGVYASSSQDFSSLDAMKEAIEAHRKEFQSNPGMFFSNGYAATDALLNAIEKAGSTEPEAVAKALRSEYVKTVFGDLRFDAKGDMEGVGFSMYKVVDGKFVEQK